MYILKSIIIISLFMLFSCNEFKNLDSITEVKKLEILAIKADKPEAYTDSYINLEMLIGEPVNYNGEYHKIWLLCDPGNHGETESGLSTCMYDLKNHLSIITSDIDKFTFKMQKSTLESHNLQSKYVYVLGGICKNTLEKCQNLIINIDKEILLKNNDIFKFAFKRIRIVADNYTITNKNPIIEEVFIQDKNIFLDNTIKLDKREYNIKLRLSNDSFYGSIGENEFIPISWKTNFGYFSKDKTYQFYGNNEIEEIKLIINEDSNANTNKKIYILVFNLRGGTTWKVINVD